MNNTEKDTCVPVNVNEISYQQEAEQILGRVVMHLSKVMQEPIAKLPAEELSTMGVRNIAFLSLQRALMDALKDTNREVSFTFWDRINGMEQKKASDGLWLKKQLFWIPYGLRDFDGSRREHIQHLTVIVYPLSCPLIKYLHGVAEHVPGRHNLYYSLWLSHDQARLGTRST